MVQCGRCGEQYDDGLAECPACKADALPFYRKNLEVDLSSRPISIRLNDGERALLEDIKATLDLSSDGAALKQAAFVGWDVLQRTLGRENLRWLADKERRTRGVKDGRA